MKSVLFCDLLTINKFLRSGGLIGLVAAVVIGVAMQNIYIAVALETIMVSISLAITLVSVDERNNWQSLRLALPFSRADIVRGRYASTLLITLIGLVLGTVAAALVIALSSIIPSAPSIAELLGKPGWQALVLVEVSCFAVVLIILSVMLPLNVRFGMIKSVRYFPLIFLISVPLGYVAKATGFFSQRAVVDFLSWVVTPQGTIMLAVIIGVASLALFAASSVLSTKLYMKREL